MKGFTLIELVIVLVILGILSTGAYVQWNAAKTNLGAEADKLAQAIRYTQSLSMTKNQRYRLVETSSTTYQITNSSGTPIIQPSGNTTVTLYSGISFGTFSNLPNNLIVFDSKGIPYTDTGTPGAALSATATMTLTASGTTKSITIAPQTGRVNIQ
jgi:prepilin-type N-terminal cleavage/methylation domain-containing protein